MLRNGMSCVLQMPVSDSILQSRASHIKKNGHSQWA